MVFEIFRYSRYVFLCRFPNGILMFKTGATIMPHALFLGSYLSTQDRVSEAPVDTTLPSPTVAHNPTSKLKALFSNLFKVSRADRGAATSTDYRSKHGERENNSISFIRLHLNHNIVDIVSSLSLVAFPINSACGALSLFSCTFDSSSTLVFSYWRQLCFSISLISHLEQQ